MKTTLSLIVASTAVAAVLAVPAIGAMRGDAGENAPIFAATLRGDAHEMPLMLVSGYEDDDDDDEHRKYRKSSRYDDDDDDDDDDDNEGKRGAGPAPAGTVAPPSNGLFSDGAKPQVKMK